MTKEKLFGIPIIKPIDEDRITEVEESSAKTSGNDAEYKIYKKDPEEDRINDKETKDGEYIAVKEEETQFGSPQIRVIHNTTTEKSKYVFKITDIEKYTCVSKYKDVDNIPFVVKQALYAAGCTLENNTVDETIAKILELEEVTYRLDQICEAEEDIPLFNATIRTTIASAINIKNILELKHFCSESEFNNIIETKENIDGTDESRFEHISEKVKEIFDDEIKPTLDNNDINAEYVRFTLPTDNILVNVISSEHVGQYFLDKQTDTTYVIERGVNYISPPVYASLLDNNIHITNADSNRDCDTAEELGYFLYEFINNLDEISEEDTEDIMSIKFMLTYNMTQLIPYTINKTEYKKACLKAKQIYNNTDTTKQYSELEEAKTRDEIFDKLVLKALPDDMYEKTISRIYDAFITMLPADIIERYQNETEEKFVLEHIKNRHIVNNGIVNS